MVARLTNDDDNFIEAIANIAPDSLKGYIGWEDLADITRHLIQKHTSEELAILYLSALMLDKQSLDNVTDTILHELDIHNHDEGA